MKAEYTAEDFSRGIKNPYFDKLNKKTEVTVRRDIYKIFADIGKKNGVSAEIIMNRCLTDYAKMLIKDE
ncbi:MAG: hypothetical protein LBS19_05665 [Clostridiales bacterium]|jgi:hypothetical protein|nr:hypothetical protein [Clostridiales bacterium]